MIAASDDLALSRSRPGRWGAWRLVRRYPAACGGAAVLVTIAAIAVAAPYMSTDPLYINPAARLSAPSWQAWFGTDNLGRDIFSRTLHGGRVSLIVGSSVAALAILLGLTIGLLSGYSRAIDAVLMRVMDGLMAIPEILLAIALVAITGASTSNVIVAITVAEVPRVARLVRSVVLAVRAQPYVTAAISLGSSASRVMLRHILPNTWGPLLVQGTYICAAAMITEALLSFVGAGTPPEVPSWGNIMAEGRVYFQIAPWTIFFPGLFLTLTVLAVNLMGDGLRDILDPRLARQLP